MSAPSWQLQTPISAIVFDCDGTLSAIEGIDELARENGVSDRVQSLTAEAMSKTGINPSLYQERLNLVYPRQEQVVALGQQYFIQRVPDASSVINIFKRLNKAVYLVSAGLNPAVTIFGELLQIPRENIFAVNIQFDQQGHFLDYDRASPLIHNDGKRVIVTKLKKLHPGIIHIGDGLNDTATQDLVTRFIGYGGAFYRENIAALCDYYITSASLSALLPLSLTQAEYEKFIPLEPLYLKGLADIHSGKVMTGAK